MREIGKAFSQQNPGIQVNVPRSIGSGGGIETVGKDEYPVGRVARKIKDSESQYGLTYLPIAQIPIVFYVSSNVPVRNLTHEQACDIYSGKIFNWKDVGGHDARIRVVRRQEGDSSLSVLLKSFPGFKDITITPASKTTYSDPDTVELMTMTQDAIAFGAYSDIINQPLKALSVDGVSPADSAYPYYAPLALVFKEKNRKGGVEKFIDFASSPAASDVIRKSGGLPVTTPAR